MTRPLHNHLLKCNTMSPCLTKPKKWHSMEIESKFVGPSHALQIWKYIHWAVKYMNRLNTCWTPPYCLWVHMNTNEWVRTAPEHPLSTHEWNWVSVNTHCGHMNTIESLLNVTHHGVTMRNISFLSELNDPSTLVSTPECLWVNIEHALNACECAWTSLSEYWTCSECLWACMHTNEWMRTALNMHWVCTNAFE